MKIYTTKQRPNVPAAWIIYNAPRPLYGHREWTDAFLTGIFYAAIEPNGAEATWMILQNETNGAAEVVYITEAQAIEAYLRNNRYADKYREMLKDAGVWQRQVVHALDMLNEGKLTL